MTHHCRYCRRCQVAKAPKTKPAPLQLVIASCPWEMVTVDILKVPTSLKGSQCIPVAQEYFSKWHIALAIPDQKANTIVQILNDDIFSLFGPPKKLHSDQGSNFESRVLSDLCQAFGIKKSRTIPHHPMGDGLVEQMNRSLLNLLRCYVDREGDWEQQLQTLRIVPTPECCLTGPLLCSVMRVGPQFLHRWALEEPNSPAVDETFPPATDTVEGPYQVHMGDLCSAYLFRQQLLAVDEQ